MSTWLEDDSLLDDMASALYAFRQWLSEQAEHYPDMDNSGIDGLLARYTEETGRRPPRVDPEPTV